MDAVVKSVVMRMLARMRSTTRKKERRPRRVPFLRETLFLGKKEEKEKSELFGFSMGERKRLGRKRNNVENANE